MEGSEASLGKVVCHFTMSLDGFVAGPGHDMSWLAGVTVPPGLIDRYVASTGAIVAGRRGWQEVIGTHRPYGGKWSGPVFVLTHHPVNGHVEDGVTYVDDLRSALAQARAAAGAKNVEIFSPGIGKQALELGLLDEFDLHVAPVLLGDGVRLYEAPGATPVALRHSDGSRSVVDLRLVPAP
ncbi:dihydrofolate reductase family protein [Nocardioides sp. CER19]|uniref:dihydrofolate reductase family protein n=1 Tax=Nocardioides sp. CER19 TaxID=3038538 RepID=UPI0024491C29|nr:dihydrofolate reductase family protein [Nocardioides sp. CER19]MDH2413810.1 dihydrofolate reductase family protein [Nocardioides sp. CER19]